jgi:hypothetical protein
MRLSDTTGGGAVRMDRGSRVISRFGWWRECRDGRWVDGDAAGKLDEMLMVSEQDDLPSSGQFGEYGERGGGPGLVEGYEDVVEDDGNGGESPVDALGLELVDSGEPQREVELGCCAFGQFVERLFFVVGADDDQ